MNATVVDVTPKMAKQLLDKNTHNRPIRQSRVDRYTKDMLEGLWVQCGDTVCVSETGVLLNGQHRLLAVVASGVTIRMILVTGIADDAFPFMDGGVPRSGADALSIEGRKNCNTLSAAAKLVKAYTNGKWREADNPSNHAIVEMVGEYVGLEESARVAASMKFLAGASGLCAAHYLVSRKDKDGADAFFEYLKTGAGMTATDPIHLLRDRLLREKAMMDKKLPAMLVVALIVKTWNLTRSGKTLGRLQFSRSDYNKEKMQQPI